MPSLIMNKAKKSLGGTDMIPFSNRQTLESSVKRIVRQSFPFASPTEFAMEAVDKGLRGGGIEYTAKVPGSNRERFVWGSSRMGSSRLIG